MVLYQLFIRKPAVLQMLIKAAACLFDILIYTVAVKAIRGSAGAVVTRAAP